LAKLPVSAVLKLYPVSEVGWVQSNSHPDSVHAPPALPHTVALTVPEYPVSHVMPVLLNEAIFKSPPSVDANVYPVGAEPGSVQTPSHPATV